MQIDESVYNDARNHIESHYPPDSCFESTAAIGRELMDNIVSSSFSYSNWRELPAKDMLDLAIENLIRGENFEIALELITVKRLQHEKKSV